MKVLHSGRSGPHCGHLNSSPHAAHLRWLVPLAALLSLWAAPACVPRPQVLQAVLGLPLTQERWWTWWWA